MIWLMALDYSVPQLVELSEHNWHGQRRRPEGSSLSWTKRIEEAVYLAITLSLPSHDVQLQRERKLLPSCRCGVGEGEPDL